ILPHSIRARASTPALGQTRPYRLLPEAQLAVFPDADHFVTRTKVRLFAGLVKAFGLSQQTYRLIPPAPEPADRHISPCQLRLRQTCSSTEMLPS
ncbi:MAG: hypothetical protein ACK2U1_08575, partial [Anaerolineales bacterium]